MKKVKIMFATLAIMAVVGSSLAFKAKSFATGKLYTLQGSSCVISDPTRNYDIVDLNNPNATVSIDVATPATCTYPINFAVEQ